ncbi:hypothetical protein BW716_10695 [[Flexibacter] sp. ATCC 35208]|nr:hypothetical protein BW716_10695 [[Flexibacter] sp. ATCC 35208]
MKHWINPGFYALLTAQKVTLQWCWASNISLIPLKHAPISLIPFFLYHILNISISTFVRKTNIKTALARQRIKYSNKLLFEILEFLTLLVEQTPFKDCFAI